MILTNGLYRVLISEPGDIPDVPPVESGTNVYFEDLALQPMQLELSFMRTERVNADNKYVTSYPGLN